MNKATAWESHNPHHALNAVLELDILANQAHYLFQLKDERNAEPKLAAHWGNRVVMITLFLADDHTIMRDGLRALLEAQPDFVVVGDAANGREALKEIAELKPAVVLMDITMPELNGIEATIYLQEWLPSAQVIILSMHASREYVLRALRSGARGYLLKESAGSEVVTAVRTVHAGSRYLSRKIADSMIDELLRRSQSESSFDPLEPLSLREREVLQLIVEGNSTTDIAQTLALSVKTVETYRSRLMRKLEIGDLPTLVKFAIQHGLTPLE